MIKIPSVRKEHEGSPSSEGERRRFIYTRAAWDLENTSTIPVTREAMGRKALSLLEMTQLGLPVPPWYTIRSEVGRQVLQEKRLSPSVVEELAQRNRQLEHITTSHLGDPKHPLFVSVRSGAKHSMPGAMDTIVNIGITDTTLHALTKTIGEHNANVAYAELVRSFGRHVYTLESEIEDLTETVLRSCGATEISDLSNAMIQTLTADLKHQIRAAGYEFPQDATKQLLLAVETVFDSWNNQRAISFRKIHGIPDELATAVTVQKMVFGNTDGNNAGAGVVISRNPTNLGEAVVGFIPHTQGTKVVGTSAHAQMTIDALPITKRFKKQLARYMTQLEIAHGHKVQDIEFTIEHKNGKRPELYLLQDRDAPLTNFAYVRWIFEQIEHGRLTESQAMRHTTHNMLQSLLEPDLDPNAIAQAKKEELLLATGLSINEGYATAVANLSIEEARQEPLLSRILVVDYINEEQLSTLPSNIVGLVAGNGGIGGHTARVGARLGIPVIFNSHAFHGAPRIEKNELITISGTTGEIFRGFIAVADAPDLSMFSERQRELIRLWHDEWEANRWRYIAMPEREQWMDQHTSVESDHRAHSQKVAIKAQIEDTFIRVVPSVIRMRYDIFNAKNIESVQHRLHEIIENGSDATIRTAYHPDLGGGKGPWVSLTSHDAVERFFSDPDYPDSKYKGYARWKSDSALTELLVGQVPKDKLNRDPEIVRQHGSWVLTATKDHKIRLQILPHSPQLRDQDLTKHDGIITYEIPIHPQTGAWREDLVPDIGNGLDQDNLAMAQTEVVFTTMHRWWQEYDLAARLAVIGNVFPASEGFFHPALQGQVRIFPDGSSWMLVYDVNVDLPEEAETD